MKFNINDICKVTLTNFGEDILIRKDPVAYEYNYNTISRILQTELWVLMNIFGKSFYFEYPNIFKNNEIEIIK